MFKRSKIHTAVLVSLSGGFVLAASPVAAQERVVITGTRILKSDLQAASPTLTVSESQIMGRQDITLDTILNTLPQVNPAGTTTSNNPGNGGQSNVDLRGLGSNRNLILVDGRRTMVSASDQTVDMNSIPMSLIESIEVITGGAGAVYGADAVAGVVNIKLKRRFEGLKVSVGTSDSTKYKDSRENSFSLVGGANFDGNRGNGVIYVDQSKRELLIKSQRDFAAVATATTSFFPEGTFRPGGNNPTQAAVDALYGQNAYRQPLAGFNQTTAGGLVPYASGDVPASSAHSFNTDGSLIYPGIFNSPRDVRNWRYPIDTGINTNIFPDTYSYNFDAVNVLVLPLNRLSIGAKANYLLPGGTELFGRFSETSYSAKTALAPSPVPTIRVAATGRAAAGQAESPLVVPGQTIANELVVPVTNPFIPADLRTLLASRTGDSAALVGSGATEPFRMRWRTLGAGLREANYENNVLHGIFGAKGDIGASGWAWEASYSFGQTKIANTQTGNIETNRLLNALGAADGGASLCAGGVNPFGRQALSASCASYLNVDNTVVTTLKQNIAQAFVTGDVAKIPAGSISTVAGVEFRDFEYDLDPGTASGPISGFNVQAKAGGKNKFTDIFGELQIPLLRRAPFAQSLDLSLAARTSQSEFSDTVNNTAGDKNRNATFALNMTWQPTDTTRVRGSLQRSARAPNFSELFDGGGSAPQYFDPCSATSVGRTTGANAGQLSTLCGVVDAAGVPLPASFVQTPGTQASISTGGNTALKPEQGTSVTFGLVFSPSRQSALSGFTASVDYYQISIKNAIQTPDVNEIIADCYNYYGRNAGYSPTYASCEGITRGGADILFVDDVNDPTGQGLFAGTNGGKIKTSGLDFALGWRNRVGMGELSLGLNWTHLLSYKSRSATFLPEKELAGTIPYFGAGLGQAFPKDKLMFSVGYDFGPVALDARYRWFSSMTNRMAVNFPGEKFTGTPATGYLDVGVSAEIMKVLTLRVGLNNALDQQARTYAPNVQSGTDPSTFDVIGRRLFVQASAKF